MAQDWKAISQKSLFQYWSKRIVENMKYQMDEAGPIKNRPHNTYQGLMAPHKGMAAVTCE